VIQPIDFTDEWIEAKKLVNTGLEYSDLVAQLNKIFDSKKLNFVEYDLFYDNLPEKDKAGAPPKNAKIIDGIKFGLFHPVLKKMLIVIEPTELPGCFKNSEKFKKFKDFCDKVARHETVHMQQAGKIQAPNEYELPDMSNRETYLADKREIMAYARTSVDEMIQAKMSPEKIRKELGKKNPSIKSHAYNLYLNTFGPDHKIFKRFLKSVYQYLDADGGFPAKGKVEIQETENNDSNTSPKNSEEENKKENEIVNYFIKLSKNPKESEERKNFKIVLNMFLKDAYDEIRVKDITDDKLKEYTHYIFFVSNNKSLIDLIVNKL
jgi:hypothetical protein